MITSNKGERMKLLIGSTLIAAVFLTGCANTINDNKFKNVPIQTTTEGVKYKVFTIEECKFIGTQDNEKVWHLAGPTECYKK